MINLNDLKEIDVPPHILKLFNNVFEENLQHIRIYVDDDSKVTDKHIWEALVSARDKHVHSDLDEDDDNEDEVLLNQKKITWH